MTELLRERYQLKQTIVTVTSQQKSHIDAALRAIKQERAALEDFIRQDSFFMLTLEPYDLSAEGAPRIVREMVRAGSAAGIGPMSAVAGTIARFALEAMIDAGATYAIVDNGGDIALINDRTVAIGIYAGSSSINNLALEIAPRKGKRSLGICTSSGTVGPSMSFGFADAAVVVSEDVSLADAAATALGNAVPESGPLEDSFGVVDVPGIEGAIVVRGEEMALWGDLPPIKKAKLRPDLITRA